MSLSAWNISNTLFEKGQLKEIGTVSLQIKEGEQFKEIIKRSEKEDNKVYMRSNHRVICFKVHKE